jgi:hypothetical protein
LPEASESERFVAENHIQNGGHDAEDDCRSHVLDRSNSPVVARFARHNASV